MKNKAEEIQNIVEIVLDRYKENLKEDNKIINSFTGYNDLLLSMIDNDSDTDKEENLSFTELTSKKKQKKIELFHLAYKDSFTNAIHSSLDKMLTEVDEIKNVDINNTDEDYNLYLMSHPLMKTFNRSQYTIIKQKMKESLDSKFKDNTTYKYSLPTTAWYFSINDDVMEVEEYENNEDISLNVYLENNSNDYSDDYDDQNDGDDDYTITNN